MATRGLPDWPWNRAEADALPVPERLLLDSIRAWHRAAETQAPLRPALHILLASEGAEAAAAPLDQLLRLAASARVACPLCPRVAPDEAALLLLCSLAQHGARSEALAAALRLLPLRAAYAAMPVTILTGATLRQAGLVLRDLLREALRSPTAPRR